MQTTEQPSAEAPPRVHGCLSAFVIGIALTMVLALGFFWLLTATPDATETIFPNTFLLDILRALGFALIVGIPAGVSTSSGGHEFSGVTDLSGELS